MQAMALIRPDESFNLHNLIDKKRMAMPQPRFNCTQSRPRKVAISRLDDDSAVLHTKQINVPNVLSQAASKK
jgi:hypothetical protein